MSRSRNWGDSFAAEGSANLVPDLAAKWSQPDIYCPKMTGPVGQLNYWHDSCRVRQANGCQCVETTPKCDCGRPVSKAWQRMGATKPCCHHCARRQAAKTRAARQKVKEFQAEKRRLLKDVEKINRRIARLDAWIAEKEGIING